MEDSAIVFFDIETDSDGTRVFRIGAARGDLEFNSSDRNEFKKFANGARYACGHNIIRHDLAYVSDCLDGALPIDTLSLSPLLFPNRPYHALVKDGKLQSGQLNNPLSDAKTARDLFYDEVNAFNSLDQPLRDIFHSLLFGDAEFAAFFRYLDLGPAKSPDADAIRKRFSGQMCLNCVIDGFMRDHPVELAYALALINGNDSHSITPPWLERTRPKVSMIVNSLRCAPCQPSCSYCSRELDARVALEKFFGFREFRKYNGEPLQERAVRFAIEGRSLLAVFPTGGGKSLAFQLPAMIAGELSRALTVVISPLQSLMKDQVDNLESRGYAGAVAINGLLNPVERSEAIEHVFSGLASILYISPEQLRSPVVERMILSRNCVRFVIDEAHCFSAWGQDFRPDYLHIADFISEYQKSKNLSNPPSVSCFTATAKQKVIADIAQYFRSKLGIALEILASSAQRENLRYSVFHVNCDDDKYPELRMILSQRTCPAIVYVSRTKRALKLAQRLSADGIRALPFHGKMDSAEKIANQEAFARNEARVVVATSAFGMGVDKKDIGLVAHYDISDSLENYIQEAGRAGRDEGVSAECHILYCDDDLDKHFLLLNQTKLSMSEIQQVWRAIKDMTRQKPFVSCTALEIARQAGWDELVTDVETRVKTAVAALENAGYVKRERNSPRIYASAISARDMAEASGRIDMMFDLDEKQKMLSKRIIKLLISSRSRAEAGNEQAESRIDYISDILGATKEDVIHCVNAMRQRGLLDDSCDMIAHFQSASGTVRAMTVLGRFAKLERFLLNQLEERVAQIDCKSLNQAALDAGIASSTAKDIRTLLNFLGARGYAGISRFLGSAGEDGAEDGDGAVVHARPDSLFVSLRADRRALAVRSQKRLEACRLMIASLRRKADEVPASESARKSREEGNKAPEAAYEAREGSDAPFSLVGMWKELRQNAAFAISGSGSLSIEDVEECILYLSKIGALRIDGGFLVLYNAMQIRRLELDNKIKYKKDDYKTLDGFYKQRIQQIHIIGEYANMMLRDYDSAMLFVRDYFQMDHKLFMAKYFSQERQIAMERNITAAKHERLFGDLSQKQAEIIGDSFSRIIVVAAAPGSGKTKTLVHKLASLLYQEDVKTEQLLMLTFSRAAASEFSKRLRALVGNAVGFVEIKTFHSYAFDLMGRPGSLENADGVVKEAARMIREGEVERRKVAKSVLVIDEAQDMSDDERSLVEAIIEANDDIRVIAVGDDDQCIYKFRGSDPQNMRALAQSENAKTYELLDNYRSLGEIVSFANAFAGRIKDRMKSLPARAARQGTGRVTVTRCFSRNIEVPAANLVMRWLDEGKEGTIGILTDTNLQAMSISGILARHGVRAKLVQSNDGFRAGELAEVRHFLKFLKKRLGGTAGGRISDEVWKEESERIRERYRESSDLAILKRIMAEFDEVNPRGRYMSDFEDFVNESECEDFLSLEKDEIFVSTVHKAKGRQFDSVCMALSSSCARDDEETRKIYVGITRARNELAIFCDFDAFGQMDAAGARMTVDKTAYGQAEEISLRLSHKDVNLGFFAGKERTVFALKSGMPLRCSPNGLLAPLGGKMEEVVRYSKAFMERLGRFRLMGYAIAEARIGHILAWRDKSDPDCVKEIPIILPILRLVNS